MKELIPILIGAFIWGKQWKGATITAHCNNAAVVAILNSRYTADDHMMQMLRCLFFVEAHFQFQLHTVHIPGKHTSLADHLSRNHLHAFLSETQSATPSSITCSSFFATVAASHGPQQDTSTLDGCSSSILLFKGISRFHSKNLPICHEEV